MVGRVLVFEGARLQRRKNTVHAGEKDVGGAHELDVEGRVEHVGGGHALVHEAAVRADELGKVRQEGDDVMLGDGLDLVDAGDVEFGLSALFPDRFGRRFRDDAELGERIAGIGFDFEPDAELRFGRPDGDHVRSGIARDHRL